MKLKLGFIISIFVLSLVIAIYFLINYIEINNFLGEVEIESYVSNITWDVNLQKEVYYKEWDELEYIYLLKNESKNSKSFDINEKFFENKLDLKDLEIDYSSWTIEWKTTQVIKIRWKTKKWWKANSNDIENDKTWFQFTKSDINSDDNSNENEKVSDIDRENSEQNNENEKNSDIIDNLENYKWIWIVWDKFYSSLDNLIVLTWNWVNSIENIWIWDHVFEIIKESSKSYFVVEEDTINSWEYFVFWYNTNNELISFEKPIVFVWKKWSNVDVVNIMPNKIENDTYRWLTIQWKWFLDLISVQLSNNNIFKKTDYNIISDNVISVKIPANITTWTYYINIMTLSWIFEFPDYKFDIIEKKE